MPTAYFSKLLVDVEAGAEIVIRRGARAVAGILPLSYREPRSLTPANKPPPGKVRRARWAR